MVLSAFAWMGVIAALTSAWLAGCPSATAAEAGVSLASGAGSITVPSRPGEVASAATSAGCVAAAGCGVLMRGIPQSSAAPARVKKPSRAAVRKILTAFLFFQNGGFAGSSAGCSSSCTSGCFSFSAHSAWANSAASLYRRPGSRCSALRTRVSTSGGESGDAQSSAYSGSSTRWRVMTSSGVSPGKSSLPLSISYSTQPREYTSVAGVAGGLPSQSSGAL